jgi:periplasmic protein CpxP/Spy
MKKLILTIVLLFGLTTFAQESTTKLENAPKRESIKKLTAQQKSKEQLQRMTKELNLDEKQVAVIKVLVDNRIEKREAFKQKWKQLEKGNKEERKALRESMKAEQDATKEEMKKILTEEQFKKFEANNEERKEKMIERRKEMNETKEK